MIELMFYNLDMLVHDVLRDVDQVDDAATEDIDVYKLTNL